MGRAPGIRDDTKRQAVIEAATALIAARGPGVSLADIARRSGVSRQTIYNQFGGKAALHAALLGGKDRLGCPPCPPSAADPPRAALAAYAAELLAWLHDPRTTTTLRASARGLGFPAGRPVVASQWSLATLADYLRQETRRGRLEVADPRGAAELFFDLVLAGPQLRIAFGVARPDLDLHAHARRCARLFVDGFAARGAEGFARAAMPKLAVNPPPS